MFGSFTCQLRRPTTRSASCLRRDDTSLGPLGFDSRLPNILRSLTVSHYSNPDKGFSGCGLETIAGLKVALGLERVDLVSGDGRDDVNEGIDNGSMLGQIEGRELLDVADVGHVPGLEQSFILQR